MEPITLTKFAAAVVASVISSAQMPERLETERTYLTDVSSAMAAAAVSGDMPFDGPGAEELAVVTLAVTAVRETNMLERYSNCTMKGDKGASITAYMLMKPWALRRLDRSGTDARGRPTLVWTEHHTEREVCSDMTLASEQALHILTNFQRMNRWASPSEVFQGYVTGSYAKRVPSAYARCHSWQQQAKRFGLADDRGSKTAPLSCFRRPKKIVVDQTVHRRAVDDWSEKLAGTGGR